MFNFHLPRVFKIIYTWQANHQSLEIPEIWTLDRICFSYVGENSNANQIQLALSDEFIQLPLVSIPYVQNESTKEISIDIDKVAFFFPGIEGIQYTINGYYITNFSPTIIRCTLL